MLKLKLQYFVHQMWRTDSLERPGCWERLKAGGEGDNGGWDGWMALPTQWTWVWVLWESWCAAVHGIAKSRIWLSWIHPIHEHKISFHVCVSSSFHQCLIVFSFRFFTLVQFIPKHFIYLFGAIINGLTFLISLSDISLPWFFYIDFVPCSFNEMVY